MPCASCPQDYFDAEERSDTDKLQIVEEHLCYIISDMNCDESARLLANRPDIMKWYTDHKKQDEKRVLRALNNAGVDITDDRDKEMLLRLMGR